MARAMVQTSKCLLFQSSYRCTGHVMDLKLPAADAWKEDDGHVLPTVKYGKCSSPLMQELECGKMDLKEALDKIEQWDMDMDSDAYGSLIKQCSAARALSDGKRLHNHMARTGHDRDTFLGNLLVDMYGKCGHLEEACLAFQRICDKNVFSWNITIAAYAQNGCLREAKDMFDRMPVRDTVSWSSMVGAFAQHEHGRDAIGLFRAMQLEGIKPDKITFISVLDACADLSALADGKAIHEIVNEGGLESDVKVGTALVSMYGKCGSLLEARLLFDQMPEKNVVSWNALVAAYAQNGYLEDARRTFNNMPQRNVVSWSALIAGYAQNGQGKAALELLPWMDQEGIKPNETTFISILDACASLAALSEGRILHSRVACSGLELKLKVATALVDMYGKCGSLDEARHTFDKMSQRNVVSWNAMIGAYARFGHCGDALELFLVMGLEGIMPSWVTYISVLVACSHSGLLNEARNYFISMISDCCITPTIEHYHCLIDLTGRAGRLVDAEDLVNNMPFHSEALTWAGLVGSSRIHGDLSRGERVAEHVFEIDPTSPAHVVLSNMYAAAGKQAEVGRVRKNMKERGVKKRPGSSFIEVNNKVHEFVSGDTLHPLNDEIRRKVEELHAQITLQGFIPNTKEVLHDVNEELKESMLCFHSEKLAIAFGLLSTKAGTLRIVKNLRVCSDCHAFTKFISKLVGRQIIMRDVNRFHTFEQGVCSCADYW